MIEVEKQANMKIGKSGNDLFSQSGSNAINDFYRDKFREKQEYLMEKVQKIPHGQVFRPTHNNNVKKVTPDYEYISDPQIKVYKTKNKDGSVKFGPKCFTINQIKKGFGRSTVGHTFSQFSYIIDPYEIKQQLNSKEMIEHKKKMLNSKPFTSRSHSQGVFQKNMNLYDNKCQLKKSTSSEKPINIIPFKGTNPSKKGYNCTFEKFQHMDGVAKPNSKSKNDQKYSTKEAWKPNSHCNKTRPVSAMKSIII